MVKQIKDLCLFVICGQTLLYFQSGKKYEKICRMILELLVLASIVGIILNCLQSFGFQKGEMEASGGAVSQMQRSIEEALSKQLGTAEEGSLSGDVLESLVEKYTLEEIKTRYNYFVQQYGFEIQGVEQNAEKLQVFLKEIDDREPADTGGEEETEEQEVQDGTEDAGNPAKITEIERIEIDRIEVNGSEKDGTDTGESGESSKKRGAGKKELDTFRRQLALVFAMEEENLEVILID